MTDKREREIAWLLCSGCGKFVQGFAVVVGDDPVAAAARLPSPTCSACGELVVAGPATLATKAQRARRRVATAETVVRAIPRSQH